MAEVKHLRYLGVDLPANATMEAEVSHRGGGGTGSVSDEECVEEENVILENKYWYV